MIVELRAGTPRLNFKCWVSARVFRISIGLYADPVPTVYLNADPDPESQIRADPGPDPGCVLKVLNMQIFSLSFLKFI